MTRSFGRFVHEAFLASLFLKGLNAAAELLGAGLVYFPSATTIKRVVFQLAQHELLEDPNDLIALRFNSLASSFSIATQHFLALYLLAHGLVKLFLVVSLWQRRLWAYPAAIAVFTGFIAYQIYRYVLSPSAGLIVLTGIDVIVIVLTWLEYRAVRTGGVVGGKDRVSVEPKSV